MNRVPAEVARSTRNAVEEMFKVLVITPSSEELSPLLHKCGLADLTFTEKIPTKENNPGSPPDLIMLSELLTNRKGLQQLDKIHPAVPKIVLSTGKNNRLSFVKGRRLSELLVNPGCGDLKDAINRLESERRLIEENVSLKEEVSGLYKLIDMYGEVNHILITSEELNKVLLEVMKKIKTAVGAQGWSILLRDREKNELYFMKVSTKRTKGLKGRRLKLGEGTAGWVAEKGRPIIVNDVVRDKKFIVESDKHTGVTTSSVMSVPMRGRAGLLGVVEVINKKAPGGFTEVDLRLLTRLSDLIAIVIEMIEIHQRMAELAITDDLTKLFNTRYLQRTLDMEVERCNRYNTSVSLIFMDIDYFKNINDRFGHLVGSKVLVEIGQLLLKKLRTMDIVARYGGDEFVIVLPQTSPKYASQIAERLRKTISDTVFMKNEGYNIRLTASFGVASYPEAAISKEDLMRLADEAMYKVKYYTRNGVYAII